MFYMHIILAVTHEICLNINLFEMMILPIDFHTYVLMFIMRKLWLIKIDPYLMRLPTQGKFISWPGLDCFKAGLTRANLGLHLIEV